MTKDILERINSFMEMEEHPESKDGSILALLSDAAAEILGLRMAMYSRLNTGNAPLQNDIILAALNGAATTVATRHDCTPDKMVRAAISIADEVQSKLWSKK